MSNSVGIISQVLASSLPPPPPPPFMSTFQLNLQLSFFRSKKGYYLYGENFQAFLKLLRCFPISDMLTRSRFGLKVSYVTSQGSTSIVYLRGASGQILPLNVAKHGKAHLQDVLWLNVFRTYYISVTLKFYFDHKLAEFRVSQNMLHTCF